VSPEEVFMQDVIYVLMTVAFFVLMAGFVIGCERIVGVEDTDAVPGGELQQEKDPSVTEEVSA